MAWYAIAIRKWIRALCGLAASAALSLGMAFSAPSSSWASARPCTSATRASSALSACADLSALFMFELDRCAR